MSARLLSGKEAASALLAELKPKVKQLDPLLCIVQVGDDPASESYIRQKVRSAQEVGMRYEHRHLPEKTTKEELFAVIDDLNHDDRVTGFIVQVPLPGPLASATADVTRAIDPRKDIDGFTSANLGETFLGLSFEHLPPATPAGIIALLEHYAISPKGKHVVIVGRSNTVGKPLSVMLLNRDATVTICHSGTKDLAAMTRQADILIVAVGRAKMITASMVKPGAVVIDVGMNRVDGKLCGDVDFEAVQKVASAITPVPGGVGPMTVTALIRNCVQAAEHKD